jgi:hypothetical protein
MNSRWTSVGGGRRAVNVVDDVDLSGFKHVRHHGNVTSPVVRTHRTGERPRKVDQRLSGRRSTSQPGRREAPDRSRNAGAVWTSSGSLPPARGDILAPCGGVPESTAHGADRCRLGRGRPAEVEPGDRRGMDCSASLGLPCQTRAVDSAEARRLLRDEVLGPLREMSYDDLVARFIGQPPEHVTLDAPSNARYFVEVQGFWDEGIPGPLRWPPPETTMVGGRSSRSATTSSGSLTTPSLASEPRADSERLCAPGNGRRQLVTTHRCPQSVPSSETAHLSTGS